MRRTRPHINKLPVDRTDNAKTSLNNADPTAQPTGTLPQSPQTTWTPTIMSMAPYAPSNNDMPAQAANN